jgi:hypothetical protein
MQYMLQVCGNCKDASFDPHFFMLGAKLRHNDTGQDYDICASCVNLLLTRQNTHTLRPEFQNAAIPIREVTQNAGNSPQDNRSSSDPRQAEGSSPYRTGEQPQLRLSDN